MKRLHGTHAALLLMSTIVACVSACSESSTAARRPIDHDAQGAWREDYPLLSPGSSFQFALTETSGVLSGTGSFSGEAGPAGDLAVTGAVAKDTLRLRIIATTRSTPLAIPPTDTETFVGVLSTTDQIDGTLAAGGRVRTVRLVRLRLLDARNSDYDARSVFAGSTRDARRAGTPLAVAAMTTMTIAEPARVTGSLVPTPKSSARRHRAMFAKMMRSHALPHIATASPCRISPIATSRDDAPSAIRMPRSC
jgi:hypothetical protein